MMESIRSICLGLSLGVIYAEAAEPPQTFRVGVQVGLAVPTGDDLRVTTGSGPNPAFGIHSTWDINEHNSLRPRMDLWNFNRGHQDVTTPQPQRIETKVQGIALGGEYLYRPSGHQGRFAAGAGLYVIQWSVESTNHLVGAVGGTTQTSGTSRWTKGGFGFVVSFRLSSRLDAEARWICSRYGYESIPANLSTVGLLWHF